MLKQTIRVLVLMAIFCGAACAEEYVVWGVGTAANIEGTNQPTVIRSGDTGASWSYVGRDGQLPAVYYDGLAAVDSQTVWIAGSEYDGYGTLYRTNDSGSTWTRVGMNNPLFGGIDFGKMQIVGNDIWVMGSKKLAEFSYEQYLYHSSDNGATWANTLPEAYRTANTFQGISVTADGAVWLTGGAADQQPDSPLIIKSTDDGTTWAQSEVPGGTDTLLYVLSITASDSEKAWAIGRGSNGGKIIATTDGGNTWTIQNSSDNDGNSILAVDENVLWAVYDSSLVRTTDGGENWETVTSTGDGFTMALTAVSENIAFCADDAALAGGAPLYRTTDGENFTRITQIEGLDIPGLWQMDMVPVPEPATISLLVLGALAVLRRQRKG